MRWMILKMRLVEITNANGVPWNGGHRSMNRHAEQALCVSDANSSILPRQPRNAPGYAYGTWLPCLLFAEPGMEVRSAARNIPTP